MINGIFITLQNAYSSLLLSLSFKVLLGYFSWVANYDPRMLAIGSAIGFISSLAGASSVVYAWTTPVTYQSNTWLGACIRTGIRAGRSLAIAAISSTLPSSVVALIVGAPYAYVWMVLFTANCVFGGVASPPAWRLYKLSYTRVIQPYVVIPMLVVYVQIKQISRKVLGFFTGQLTEYVAETVYAANKVKQLVLWCRPSTVVRWASLGGIFVATYIYLTKFWTRNKRRESLITGLEDGTWKSMLGVIKAGFSVGMLTAGLIDLGFSLAPKDLGCSSIIIQVITAVMSTFPEKKRLSPEDTAKQIKEAAEKINEENAIASAEGRAPNYSKIAFVSGGLLNATANGKYVLDDSDEEDDEPEPAELLQKWSQLKDEVSRIIKENRGTITAAGLAVLAGVFLYIWIHYPNCLKTWFHKFTRSTFVGDDQLESKKPLLIAPSGASTSSAPQNGTVSISSVVEPQSVAMPTVTSVDVSPETPSEEQVLAGPSHGGYEAKGKTKGRAFKRRTPGRVAARGKTSHAQKSSYIIYDDGKIVDLIVNGEFKSYSQYVGKQLPPGEYVIVRQVGKNDRGDPIYQEEAFTIVDDGMRSDSDVSSTSDQRYADIYERLVVKKHWIPLTKDKVQVELSCPIRGCGEKYSWEYGREEVSVFEDMVGHILCHDESCEQRCFNCHTDLSLDPAEIQAHYAVCCPFCAQPHHEFSDQEMASHLFHQQREFCARYNLPQKQKDMLNKQYPPVVGEVNVVKPQVTNSVNYEALVPSSPSYKTDVVMSYSGTLLSKEKAHISHCLFVNIKGTHYIMCNMHSVKPGIPEKDMPKWVRTQGKDFELPVGMENVNGKKVPALQLRTPMGLDKAHRDLAFLKGIDGPSYMSKKFFACASAGRKMAMVVPKWVDRGGVLVNTPELNPGAVISVTDYSGGLSVEVSASTAPGDCGAPYVDSDGKVFAIHFAEGTRHKTNWGIAVDEHFMSAFDSAKN